MTTRRHVLITAMLTPLINACGGGGASSAAPHPPPTTPPPSSFAPQLPDQGVYGSKIADWSQIDASSGNATLQPGDVPPAADGAISALLLVQGSSTAFAQQNQVGGAQPLIPATQGDGFTMGVWAKNSGARTLDFTLRVFNADASHDIYWNCAIDPGLGWVLLTLSPTQQVSNGWIAGVDGIAAVHITEQDKASEGPWQAGESALFGNVYAGVHARPLFAITFDDGFSTQRNAGAKPLVRPAAYVASSSANVFTTAAPHGLIVGTPIAFTDAAPPGLAVGASYWIATVPTPATFTLAADAALTIAVASNGYAGVAPYRYAGTEPRSGQQIVEGHGFKGSLFLVPAWLGTQGVYGYGGGRNAFMSAADARAMVADGWSIGSHSATHPSSQDSAGLRLLGPYGYFLSNPVDQLPAAYVAAWALDGTHRRRAVRADAGTNVVTFENPHAFLVNMPIVFVDPSPPGLMAGTRYFCQSHPTPDSATFARDQGTLRDTVVIAANWQGLADYRHAGAADDDGAIYADIMAGIDGLAALGLQAGTRFFALPQGAADNYVRAACMRAGLQWIRGASDRAHTIAVGRPSGGGLSAVANTPGGWLAQPDCIQTDAVKPQISAIRTYVDATLAQGACGCSYHHDVGPPTLANLDNLCAYLRTKVDAKLVDVLTLDALAAALKPA
jgi:hypothetical protein